MSLIKFSSERIANLNVNPVQSYYLNIEKLKQIYTLKQKKKSKPWFKKIHESINKSNIFSTRSRGKSKKGIMKMYC